MLVAVLQTPTVGVIVNEHTGAIEQEAGAANVCVTGAQAVFENKAVTLNVCPLLTKPLKLNVPLLLPVGKGCVNAGEKAAELTVSVPLLGMFVVATRPVSVYVLLAVWHRPGVTVRLTPQTGGATIVKVSGWVSEQDLPSVTLAVKLPVPAEVGVPEMRPVLASSSRPAGKVPPTTLKVRGAVPPVDPTD